MGAGPWFRTLALVGNRTERVGCDAGTAQVWQLTAANSITRLADVRPGGTSFPVALPAQSVTLFVIPSGGTVPRAPTNLRIVGTVSGP